jgi:hypothetical protein
MLATTTPGVLEVTITLLEAEGHVFELSPA